MQRVTTDRRWVYQHYWNEPGTYILDNYAAAACLGQSPFATVETLDPKSFPKRFSTISAPDTNFELLVVRPGAFGDLLMLTPTLRALRLTFPFVRITVACAEAYMPVLYGVAKLTKYPLEEAQLKKFDRVIWLENAIENNPAAKTETGVMCLAEAAGVGLADGTHLDYLVTPAEEALVAERAPKTPKKPRVTIQCRASEMTRTYPTEKWIKVIRSLWKRGCEVMLIGTPGEITGFTGDLAVKDVHNMTDLPLSFRESAALLASSDLAITVDSSMMHVAGALGVPCISLHGGTVPAALRTSNLRRNVSIEGDHSKCPMAPCFHQTGPGRLGVPGAPCATTGECAVLNSIDPSDVVSQAVRLLNLPSHPSR
jgi:ADP-heptose:LPS heptosyltransferase